MMRKTALRQSVIGTRIRERRRQLGVTQADMARQIGISPSYLNLIERNKRRVAGSLLGLTADFLGLSVEDLDGAAERRLAETLTEIAHLPFLSDLQIEIDGTDELIARYPGWAKGIAALGRSERIAQQAAQALSDRLKHDPVLEEAVHRMLTRTAAIRSAADILGKFDDVPPEQVRRFNQIIRDEAQTLTDVGKTLVNHFDNTDTSYSVPTPQDEVEALFDARRNHFAELEGAAGDIRPPSAGQTRDEKAKSARELAEKHLADFVEEFVSLQPNIETETGRRKAIEALLAYASRSILMPLDQFVPLAQDRKFDVDAMAQTLSINHEDVFRRLTALPNQKGLPQFGYLNANASGAITDYMGLEGFGVPRFAGVCPLWILFRAQSAPETVLRQHALFPDDLPFVFVARARNVGAPGFDQPRHYLTDMIVMREEDAAQTVYAPGSENRLEAVGPSCRLCVRAECRHRVEDSISA